MEYLVIWNKEEEHPVFFERAVLAFSYEQAKTKLEAKQYRLVIILCELEYDIDGRPKAIELLSGIELGKQLRRDGIRIPFIFVSFLSRAKVYDDKPGRGIINAVGHRFIRLPFNWEKLEATAKILPLSELEAHDIIFNYCSLDGLVRLLLHTLTGSKVLLINAPEKASQIKAKIRQVIIRIHQVFNKDAGLALMAFDSQFVEIDLYNIAEAIRMVEGVGLNLIEYCCAEPEELQRRPKANGDWKLLVLDDELTEEHTLFRRLTERNVSFVLSHTVEEARRLVRQEPLMSLVVSDYRLEQEEEGVKVHQEIQGYHFLQELSQEKPNYTRLVALSSLPRRFLMESFKHFGMRVDIFSKRDYFENDATIELLCNELVELGNENAAVIARGPRIAAETWQYFEPFYRYHRSSVSYTANESYISYRAKQYCEGIRQDRYLFRLSGYTALNLNSSKSRPDNEKAFRIYLEKCICRRVALWYSQFNSMATLTDIHRAIQGLDYLGAFSSGTPRNQINYNLALSLEEYPWNMTVEEKLWLSTEMNQEDPTSTEKYEELILQEIANGLRNWLKRHGLEDVTTMPAYYSNFRMLRLFLYRLYMDLLGRDELIEDLKRLLNQWEGQQLKKPYSTNVKKLKSFIKYIGQRMRFTKFVTQEALVTINNSDEFCRDLVEEIIKRIPESEKNDFQANVYIFYHEQHEHRRQSFDTKKEWINALMAFHKKEMSNLKANGLAFDEIKAFHLFELKNSD